MEHRLHGCQHVRAHTAILSRGIRWLRAPISKYSRKWLKSVSAIIHSHLHEIGLDQFSFFFLFARKVFPFVQRGSRGIIRGIILLLLSWVNIKRHRRGCLEGKRHGAWKKKLVVGNSFGDHSRGLLISWDWLGAIETRGFSSRFDTPAGLLAGCICSIRCERSVNFITLARVWRRNSPG